MLDCSVSGHVYEVYTGTYPNSRTGQPGAVTTLSFTTKGRLKVNGQWVTETIVWGQVKAFDEQAERWAKWFKKGTAIEVAGATFHTETFTRKNGTIAVTHIFTSQTGGTPQVNYAPRSNEEASNGDSQLPAPVSDSQVTVVTDAAPLF